jgi:hypothetical protein
MFPNNSSVTRPPPSLLPGSDGTPSPVFHRYYEAATTAVVSRPHPPHFPALDPSGLVIDFACFARAGREVRSPCAWVLFTGFTHFRLLVPRDLRLSQVPREPQCAFAVFSDSGRASVPNLYGTSVLPPDHETRRASTTMKLSELYRTASALAVYASCRHC